LVSVFSVIELLSRPRLLSALPHVKSHGLLSAKIVVLLPDAQNASSAARFASQSSHRVTDKCGQIFACAVESHRAVQRCIVQKEQTPMMDIAAPAKPSAPKAVTTKHLAYMLAEQHHLGKKQSLEMMEELIGMITKHLKKGERVKIAGLGILQVRKRAARMGRNPATGETIPYGQKLKPRKRRGFVHR
jgi:DNA-binding protein HU-beta